MVGPGPSRYTGNPAQNGPRGRDFIDRHLGVLASPKAPEEVRRDSEEALLTALGGCYDPGIRLQVIRGLLDRVGEGLQALLIRHPQGIRMEARPAGRAVIVEEADRLLERLGSHGVPEE